MREAVLALLFVAFVLAVWKFLKDYGGLIRIGLGSVARRYGLWEAESEFQYGLAERPFRFRMGQRLGRPWIAAAALGLAVLIATLGVGVYYSYDPFEPIPASGEIVANDTTENPLKFTIRSEEDLDQVLVELKEKAGTVDTLRVNVNIADLRDVGGLTNLKSLDLDSTSVENLEPLKRLDSLVALDLGKTPLHDLKQLKYFPKLEWLDLSETKVRDFAPLSGLEHLKFLDLERTEITDLSSLSKLNSLRRLNLSNTEVSDLTPLSELTALQELDLSATNIKDLRPLHSLTSLEMLDLSATSVEWDQIELLREKLAEKGNVSIKIET